MFDRIWFIIIRCFLGLAVLGFTFVCVNLLLDFKANKKITKTYTTWDNVINDFFVDSEINGGDISGATIYDSLTWNASQDLNSQTLTNINSGAIESCCVPKIGIVENKE